MRWRPALCASALRYALVPCAMRWCLAIWAGALRYALAPFAMQWRPALCAMRWSPALWLCAGFKVRNMTVISIFIWFRFRCNRSMVKIDQPLIQSGSCEGCCCLKINKTGWAHHINHRAPHPTTHRAVHTRTLHSLLQLYHIKCFFRKKVQKYQLEN